VKIQVRYLLRMIFLLHALAGGAVLAIAAECNDAVDDAVRRRAEQKVLLLERLTGDTDPVQRVFDSGRVDAIAAIEAARKSVTLARQEVDAGCSSKAGQTAVNGLSQAAQAFRLSRDETVVGVQEYQALHRRTTSFLQMLESQPVELQGIGAADLAGMRRQLNRSEILAVNGDFREASEELGPVADRLERRLITILDQQTVYYEKEFANSEDEFAYLIEQYRGYRLLLRHVTAEKQLPFSRRASYENALQNASNFNDGATKLADNGDWQPALAAMQEAIGSIEKALRLIGVVY
jgi:hypothetical protein